MFEEIKGIFIIIILCAILVISSKVIYLIKYIISNKSISIIDEIKGLDYENFYYLALESLSRRNYNSFSIVDENILRCSRDNEEYMIILNNDEDSFKYENYEVFYGYMIAYGIKKVLFFMASDLQKGAKEFFEDTDVEVIEYSETNIVDDYNSIIKNVQ